jgi:selenide,water dikinase
MEAALQFDLHACTDITGFGILGHLLEVAHGCDARVVMHYASLLFYNDALNMYKKGETTGSNKPNRAMVHKHNLNIKVSLSSEEEELLYDPQTSGGLLLAVPGSQANDLMASLAEVGVPTAANIGEILAEPVGIDVV